MEVETQGYHPMIHSLDIMKDLKGQLKKEEEEEEEDEKSVVLLPPPLASCENHGNEEKKEKMKKKGIRLKWAEGIIDNQNKESSKKYSDYHKKRHAAVDTDSDDSDSSFNQDKTRPRRQPVGQS